MSKSIISRQNQLIEYIARKSLICLILTFVVNLAMNLLKVTMFIGDRSDVRHISHQLRRKKCSTNLALYLHRHLLYTLS